MAFTDSGIFISTAAGSVICLGDALPAGESGDGPAGSKTKLPEQVDLGPSLRSFGLEPRVQGDRPTCSVFVVVQALEYAVARKAGRGRELSVEYLNWASNRVNGDRKDGGFFSDLWKGFQVHGICAEKSMPYRSTRDRRVRPSSEARAGARKALSLGLRLHWIKEWDPNKGLTDGQLREVRATLARGWPVCGGFLWPKKQVWKDRVLQMCPRDAVRDGHSVFLVGYRDDPSLPGGGVFLIRNSSGKLREGFLTYEFVKAYMNDAAWIAPEEQERQAKRK
jgi:hypothetical protein